MTPVTKDIAVWLKGLGFDEKVYMWYKIDGELTDVYKSETTYLGSSIRYEAPFIPQALTWLADVKKVSIAITIVDNSGDIEPKDFGWYYGFCFIMGSGFEPIETNSSPSYADCQTALLELIYNNKEQLGL
jgi:hypothetical protein